ncbi:hypothetical protein [Deinococcus radiotolerans]|uniref:Uncharacterized protein n=1 Tax=Deinococcus radiotolerans TaxID=1309407 RepID=A0ABQ2FGR4_9DEIO|nr:hypothetical protein [Deinococcus radiotolerans]GGK85856.1 hypothetical protein GCM10010844_00470 [Deinococcus radiotolerans]
MNVTRHFSDTRTAEGRVRILVQSAQFVLDAEGPGWQHRSVHRDLGDITLELAWLPRLSASLYGEVLEDMARRVQLDGALPGGGATDLPGAA